MKNFFYFCSKLSSSTLQAHADNLKTNENGIDDEWNLVKGKYKSINFPVIFKQKYGKKLTDILDTGWPGLCLISDRMKMILEEHKLTGWMTYLIKLYDKKGGEIPGYHGFSVIGRCGPVTYDDSSIIERIKFPVALSVDIIKVFFLITGMEQIFLRLMEHMRYS